MSWLKLGRKPIRRRRNLGPLTVNTSDLHVSSTTWKAGRLSRNSRTGWKLRLLFGFHLKTGGK